jgi:hypothetical protein
MFARVVEFTIKEGKLNELRGRLGADVLPLLQQQRGFVDELVLRSEANRILAISLWREKELAEQYQLNQFSRILELIQLSLSSPPTIDTFEVEVSTPHKIAPKAA